MKVFWEKNPLKPNMISFWEENSLKVDYDKFFFGKHFFKIEYDSFLEKRIL